MSKLTPNFYKLSGLNKTKTYIETGTYYGLNLEEVLNEYRTIYSIEIEKKWIEYNKKKFEGKKNIKLIQGDSSLKLPELCFEIKDEVTFFLDAHYSGEGTGYKEKISPIIEELESIFNRKNKNDIVIIDDSRLFGKITVEGSDDHPYYKRAELDWTSIPFENIKKLIPPKWKILNNYKNSLSFGKEDQLIVCNISLLRTAIIKIYQYGVLINNKFISFRKVIRHYLFYFIKLLLPDRVYKKIKDFLR
tara:strand:- start:119 stop:859 length:741 start_codon:yes stop_codon:yes gene_type:complete